MTKILMCLCLMLASLSASAQVRADGKWHFPDSVRSLCLNTEQNLVATYRALVEKNREWADDSLKVDKSNYAQLTEHFKKTIVEYESSWDRMGCAGIIYGARK
jgi:hypothetical protein